LLLSQFHYSFIKRYVIILRMIGISTPKISSNQIWIAGYFGAACDISMFHYF
jgi:hypothetical protein